MALVVACDQLSKWWILRWLGGARDAAVSPFLNIVLVWNKGITFGLLNRFDHRAMPWILAGMAAVIFVMLGRWLWLTRSGAVALGLALVMGGAVGNVIDRLRYGAVVDFLDFHYQSYHWYAFNVADAAIVTGVCLLLLDGLVRGR